MMLMKSVQLSLLPEAEEEDVPRVHPLQVEFTGRKNEYPLNLLMCNSV